VFMVSRCVDSNLSAMSAAGVSSSQLVQYGHTKSQATAVNRMITESWRAVSEAALEEAKTGVDGEDEEVNVVDDED